MIKQITLVPLLIVGVLLILTTFFSPIIISAITGNWWYMLLFLVSYIPCIGEFAVLSIIYVMLYED